MTIEMRKPTEGEMAACKACQYYTMGGRVDKPTCPFSCTLPTNPNLTYADYMKEWEQENVPIDDIQLPKQSSF
jgi:hypothetical protein